MHCPCRTDAHATPRAGHSSHGAGNAPRRTMSRSTAKSRAMARDHRAGHGWPRVAVRRVRHAKLREVSLLRAAPPAVREIVRVPRLPCVALPCVALPCVALPHGAASARPRTAAARACLRVRAAVHCLRRRVAPASARAAADRPVYTNTHCRATWQCSSRRRGNTGPNGGGLRGRFPHALQQMPQSLEAYKYLKQARRHRPDPT
jgi:hypothetical protein